MRKTSKQIMAFLLAIVMVVCLAPMNAKAAISSGKTLTSKNSYGYVTVVGNPADVIGDTQGYPASEYAKDLGALVQFKYTQNDRIDESNTGRVFPIQFSNSGYILLNTILYSGETGVGMTLYADPDCTRQVGYGNYHYNYGEIKTSEIKIPAAGTYYLEVSNWHSYSDSGSFTNSAGFEVLYFPNKSMTLPAGKIQKVGCQDSAEYYKFKATATGYVTFEIFKDADYIYDTTVGVALLNSNKKALSVKTNLSSYNAKVAYGVQKGKTYYFKVTDADGMVALRYKMKKVSEKSGSTLKKAPTLKASKTVSGTIIAGSSVADCYKIKVTKSKVLKFKVSGNSNGRLMLTLYKSNGKKWAASTVMVNGVGDKDTLTTNKKVTKGTYYIRVHREGSKSSGHYNLRWS